MLGFDLTRYRTALSGFICNSSSGMSNSVCLLLDSSSSKVCSESALYFIVYYSACNLVSSTHFVIVVIFNLIYNSGLLKSWHKSSKYLSAIIFWFSLSFFLVRLPFVALPTRNTLSSHWNGGPPCGSWYLHGYQPSQYQHR